jgi:hypothetical protein
MAKDAKESNCNCTKGKSFKCQWGHWPFLLVGASVATVLWPSVGVKPNTSKVGDLESSGTPECLELNSKAQNNLHWNVLGVIEKALKLRYRKWPRIGHSDICSPSYGQTKGRESNWQVWLPTTKSRESTSSRHPNWECDTALERSRRGIQLWFRPRRDRTMQSGVMSSQSPGTPTGTLSGQFRDFISGLHFGSPKNLCHLDVAFTASCREYCMGEGDGFPRVRAVVSLVCQSARGLSQHPRVFPNAKLTSCG